MGPIGKGRLCKSDDDCPDRQYCYQISERCVDYTLCSRYNRLEAEKLSRDPSQCGPCMNGYTAEILGTGENAILCNKIAVQTESSEPTMNTTTIIGIMIATLMGFIIGIILYTLCKKRHYSKCKIRSTELNDSDTARASAPPAEHSPFMGFSKKRLCLPYNNNENVIDNNSLVTARPFVPPSWVSNANYNSNQFDNDADNTPNEQNIASQLPTTNNNPSTSNWSSAQVTVQPAELTTEYQDNIRNNILVGNYPVTSNQNTSNDSTSEPRENTNTRNGARTNVLINQNVTMHVNLINGDDC